MDEMREHFKRMLQSATYACQSACRICGCRVDVWQYWNGLAYVPIFVYHDEEDSEGEVVFSCPCCGEEARSAFLEKTDGGELCRM